jgi:hypothetical protein
VFDTMNMDCHDGKLIHLTRDLKISNQKRRQVEKKTYVKIRSLDVNEG